MGWHQSQTQSQSKDYTVPPDPKNPWTMMIEDEGEFVTIVHKQQDFEDGEGEDGGTDNRCDLSE